MFVTSQGSAHGRFTRAIQRGNLFAAEMAARELRRCLYRVVQATAVYKENVKQPVIVEIEQGHSASHSLYQVLLRRGRISVHEVDARRPDDAQDQLGSEQGDNRKNDSRGDSSHASNSNIAI